MSIWAIILIALFWVCTKTPLLASLFTLFVLGMVPGTHLAIPAWLMLIVYPAGFFAAVYWLSARSLYIGTPTPKPAVKAARAATTRKKKSRNQKQTAAAKRRARATA
jgi:hypothetical protein